MLRTWLAGSIMLATLVVACSGGAAAPVPPVAATAAATPIAVASPTPEPTSTAAPTPSAAPSPTPEPDYNAVPLVAEDPVGIAKQLALAETAIRDPNVTGPKLIWMGHLQQLAVSQVNDNPKWTDQILASLPEGVRKSVAGTLAAGRELRQLKGPTPKTLPDWKIVEPASIDDLLKFYKEGEQKYGVAWYYLAAINLVETRMGRIRGVSSAGALGPMQFIQSTWDAYGEGDVNDPHDAILGAARYLKAAGAPGDMNKALYAYNHSLYYVNAIAGYAEVMKADPNAFRGYYGWQVYYTTVDGTSWLKVGWKKE